jgi:hypothetical protein
LHIASGVSIVHGKIVENKTAEHSTTPKIEVREKKYVFFSITLSL